MKHSNVAIFVPHNGCPHQCVFCNQKNIIGQVYQPTSNDVESAIEIALDSLKENSVNAEIAFFGGSFTAIDRAYMLSLLDATVPYIDKFRGIRISTRPDAIDNEVLDILKRYNVTSIELGAQSMNDYVLKSNERGHSALDVYIASQLIKAHGFSLGLQMMTGLYSSSDDIDIDTARRFIDIRPDTVRIYETVVMKNTKLCELYDSGEYIPHTLEQAVDLCSKILLMFERNDINVIRLGLHHSDSLDAQSVAGAYHPAFKELCESKIMFDNLLLQLDGADKTRTHIVLVSPKSVSKLIGNNRSNILRLNELGYNIKIIQDNTLEKRQVVLNA